MNGTQVSGPRCVCLASGLCLFSLHNGPQLSAVAPPELIGSQWAGMEPPPPPPPSLFHCGTEDEIDSGIC